MKNRKKNLPRKNLKWLVTAVIRRKTIVRALSDEFFRKGKYEVKKFCKHCGKEFFEREESDYKYFPETAEPFMCEKSKYPSR